MTTLAPVQRLRLLRELERKVLWLSAWTIHNANHLRPNRDGLKVGGHQASCASLATVMTALYFSVLKPEDRVAVKPHASPVFHADSEPNGIRQHVGAAIPLHADSAFGIEQQIGDVGAGRGVN